jgi:2,3-bisphosphoglycerate-independent phosphoglycerate mutase
MSVDKTLCRIILKSTHGQYMGKKPILLCILDGFGIAANSADNAIYQAKMPNYHRLLNNFPNSQLGTSGLDVGLPEGQMGNSEVGHTCIGSGRIIFQDLPRINNAIKDGTLEQNQNLQNLISACKKSTNVCHLMGLLSDGGVHSHQSHIIALAKILAKKTSM